MVQCCTALRTTGRLPVFRTTPWLGSHTAPLALVQRRLPGREHRGDGDCRPDRVASAGSGGVLDPDSRGLLVDEVLVLRVVVDHGPDDGADDGDFLPGGADVV